ncbi:hypothetical protein NPIL_360471 [Nephila pilipes]|uniref:Uncharacterized protein n=1 Tax=Nephila pilipes TaxID=299642 RepID=A0A8X6QTM5_NEPPI|nr:hypothetical protein NPIL_360471 [Nephila pilipes]
MKLGILFTFDVKKPINIKLCLPFQGKLESRKQKRTDIGLLNENENMLDVLDPTFSLSALITKMGDDDYDDVEIADWISVIRKISMMASKFPLA